MASNEYPEVNLPKVPEWKPGTKDIKISIKINGIKYGGRFDLDTSPEEIGRLVTETVRDAPKRSWEK